MVTKGHYEISRPILSLNQRIFEEQRSYLRHPLKCISSISFLSPFPSLSGHLRVSCSRCFTIHNEVARI